MRNEEVFVAGGKADRRWAVLRIVLLLVVTAVWWIGVTCPFVHLDDPLYASNNAHISSGLSADNIRWAFSNTEAGFFFPLTWLSLQLDASLFGPGPIGMHATNVLLHVLNTLLVYGVFSRLTGRPWRSFIVAALFSIHPLRVESVVWVTERKDVLSAFFGLLSLLAYVG